MSNHPSRRKFIQETGKAGLALGLASTILPALAKGTPANAGFNIPFNQQPLPYDYKDLEAAIDAMTMEIHYSKHAATYAKNLAEACNTEHVDMTSARLEDVLAHIGRYSPKMRNNAGGHFNHEMFWHSMTPNAKGMPGPKLMSAITRDLGSWDACKTQFSDAAKNRFGSGWAWLVKTGDGKLVIGSTPNQDNPLMEISELKGTPLLGLDVWEHAYYLRYQNKRPDYITNWWNVVNWDVVEKRMDA